MRTKGSRHITKQRFDTIKAQLRGQNTMREIAEVNGVSLSTVFKIGKASSWSAYHPQGNKKTETKIKVTAAKGPRTRKVEVRTQTPEERLEAEMRRIDAKYSQLSTAEQVLELRTVIKQLSATVTAQHQVLTDIQQDQVLILQRLRKVRGFWGRR